MTDAFIAALQKFIAKGTRVKTYILTMGQFLLEFFMNVVNSGSLLHRKQNISKKFWNLQI